MAKKLNIDDFIDRMKKIHNNKYDYSLVNYINIKTKIKIICPIHGCFEQTPDNHSQGKGCSKCANNIKLTNHIFIKKAKNIHGNKYDYSLVKYINSKTKVKIICPVHDVFEQLPDNHISKQYGCPKCSKKYKTLDEFILLSNNIHNNKYDYSLVNYINGETKIEIICPEHGIFKQTPEKHLIGQGCRQCKSSSGERLIESYLIKHNLRYKSEKKFKNCKDKKELPFDFYLPEQNLCIEYDGIQHFKPIEFFGGQNTFDKRKKHDQIKNNFCDNNNISLIRINYLEIKEISNILNNKIKY